MVSKKLSLYGKINSQTGYELYLKALKVSNGTTLKEWIDYLEKLFVTQNDQE